MNSEEKYNPQIQTVLEELLLDEPDVTIGKVFGLPCYKIDGKVFATIYGDSVGISLPSERVDALQGQPHIDEFRPYGKSRGRNTIAIIRENPADLRHDKGLLLEAAQFVREGKKQ